jgi:hypothetical protein
MPAWKKVIVSGSDAVLNSLTTTSGLTVTGSILVSGSINNVNYIDFNTGSAEPAWKSGRVYWNNTDGALSVYNAEADISLQVGQENWVKARNDTGALITNGTAVRLIGSHGDAPEIQLARSIQVSGSVTRDNQILGLATHDIENNSFGYITTQGLVRGLNTSAYAEGDRLYVSSSAGELTKIPPTAPYEIIPAAVVVKAGPGGSGILYADPYQPMDFTDLSSVEIGDYNYGDIFTYARSGSVGVWKHTNQLSGSYGITGSLVVTGSLDTSNRTLLDASNKVSIDWGSRNSSDSGQLLTIDWENKTLYGASEITSVEWGTRYLAGSSGNLTLEWDAVPNGYAINSGYYYRSAIGTTEQQGFIDTTPTSTGNVNYAGEIIRATLDASVADFDLVYLYTDGIWYQNTQANQNSTKLLGICLDKVSGTVLLEGTLTVLSTLATYSNSPLVQGVDHGLPIYIRDGSGTQMSTTAPTNSGEVVRVLGHAYQQSSTYTDYWVMKFRPSNDWIQI